VFKKVLSLKKVLCILKYLFVKGEDAYVKFDVYVLEKFRTLLKDSEPFSVFDPMSEKFKKLANLPFSIGNKSKWAGVTILSFNLFWYSFHKFEYPKFSPEEKLYFNELPTKVEYEGRTL